MIKDLRNILDGYFTKPAIKWWTEAVTQFLFIGFEAASLA